MKNLYLFLFLSLVITTSQAQLVNIPDTNFKAKLLNHDPVIDTNNDGEIDLEEAEIFSGFLNLDNDFYTEDADKIIDLTGIEAFVNIYQISFDYNLVETLDLSKNTLLTRLEAYNNELKELDISNNLNLIFLHVQDNQIDVLDVSNNFALQTLSCGQNNLTFLDVSQNQALTSLRFARNKITDIDVINNNSLTLLDCENNLMSNLDVSNNLILEYLICGRNLFTSLDVSLNQSLISLSCSYNQLTNLDISLNTALTHLYCGSNLLSSLDVSNNILLERLIFDRNPINSIDLSNNTQLNYLFTYDVPLESIDLSSNPLLEVFITGDNQLKSIDVSSNTNLKRLSCNNGYLLERVNLKNLDIANITQLNLKFCPNLRTICVEDKVEAQTKFISTVDPHATFVEDCDTNIVLNEIEGTLTFDSNSDGCNLTDIKIPYSLVKASDGIHEFSTLTDENGDYSISVVENSYDVTPYRVSEISHLTGSPISSNHIFTGLNQTETADFCATVNQSLNNVDIILIPTSEVLTNSTATYQIVYENLGTNVSNGVVSIQYDDDKLSFVSTKPTQDSSNSNILTFNYSNLMPFDKRIIDVTFNTLSAPTLNEGDILEFTTIIASSETDNFPEDNTYIYNQTLGDTYNANEKEVLQGAEISIDEVTNYLDYAIRFQNTSTNTASHIAITDIINPNLDWNTIRIASSSHNFTTKITDGRFVEFLFENINLPTKQDDELESKGFIAFRVKPTSNLQVGDIFRGKTEIFYSFDGSPSTKGGASLSKANITFTKSEVFNTVETTIVQGSTLSVSNNTFDDSVLLYPNPITNTFSIKVSNGIKIDKVSLYSVTGNELFKTKALETYSLENYRTGVYFVKIETNHGVINKQIVKK